MAWSVTCQTWDTSFSFRYAWTPWLMLMRPSRLPHESHRSLICFAAAGSGSRSTGFLVFGAEESRRPARTYRDGRGRIQRLASAHGKPRQRAVFPVREDAVARFDRGNHIIQKATLEDREGNTSGSAKALPFRLIAAKCRATALAGGSVSTVVERRASSRVAVVSGASAYPEFGHARLFLVS